MILTVHISNNRVAAYHPNGMPKIIESDILVQPLEILQIRKVGYGGGCCYEAMDMTGRWHRLYKSENAGKKIPVLKAKGDCAKLPE